MTVQAFYDEARAIAPWIVETRRALHRVPEEGFHEEKTRAIIREKLTELGVPFAAEQTWIIATVQGGRPGKTVALRADFDAVLLCGGARRARRLNVPGEEAGGVALAVDYLSEVTRALLECRESALTARGKDVLVVGGGDTGNDCVGTCLRQGCRSVAQLEMLPAPPVRRAPNNPWPEWPRVLRTDYGQMEAIAVQGGDPRLFETTVERVLADESGFVRAVETVRVARGTDGRLRPVEGTRRTLPCQLLLIAAGFVGCEQETAERFHVSLNARSLPDLPAATHTIAPGLFVAGDMRGGQSLVVRALADGRAAAMEVHRWLGGEDR